MDCFEICEQKNEPCSNYNCTNYLTYKEDLNCVLICARKNGPLTLEEASKRLGVSYVRIKQIEDKALKKIKEHLSASDAMAF